MLFLGLRPENFSLPLTLRLYFPGLSHPRELSAPQHWFPAKLDQDKMSPLLTINKYQLMSSCGEGRAELIHGSSCWAIPQWD